MSETGHKKQGVELRVKKIVWTKSRILQRREKVSGSQEVEEKCRSIVNENVVELGQD